MSECCSNGCSSNTPEKSQNTPQLSDKSTLSYSSVSLFNVSKMDCPSEEGIIRMTLESLTPAVYLKFDIPNRLMTVFHSDNLDEIIKRMDALNFGSQLTSTQAITPEQIAQEFKFCAEKDKTESITLKWLLAINALMFVLELTVGLYAQSTGLIADALDMFADAAVYAIALYAVGKPLQTKLKTAHISGWLQLLLAMGVIIEVIRRFIYGSDPISLLMMGMGCIALMANIICLMLIHKNKDNGAHMKASWIFSANDVIANLGVIVAGILVLIMDSPVPDLAIGLIIGLVVLNGAIRILKLKS